MSYNDFPAELRRESKVDGLILHVSSLPIFSSKPLVVQDENIKRLGFFNLTYERHYTIQEIEAELLRQGIKNANAYRLLRTKEFNLEKPYRKMKTATFSAYHIPEDLVRRDRELAISLAQSCTS